MTSEMYVVTEVTEDSIRGMSVRTFGPFAGLSVAEQERRSLHMNYVLKDLWRKPRTFVSRVEMSIE
jgi:hypothetical protein